MSIDPSLRWKLRIFHIRDAIGHIIKYTKGLSLDDFVSDHKTYHAVVRCFQICGEAVKKIPNDVIEEYPHIPWREMARFRDKVVHDYDGLNDQILWDIIRNELPQILLDIKKIPLKEEDLE